MKHKEECGCTHDGARWLSECGRHKAEHDALRTRAQLERRRPASPAPTQSPKEPDWLDM